MAARSQLSCYSSSCTGSIVPLHSRWPYSYRHAIGIVRAACRPLCIPDAWAPRTSRFIGMADTSTHVQLSNRSFVSFSRLVWLSRTCLAALQRLDSDSAPLFCAVSRNAQNTPAGGNDRTKYSACIHVCVCMYGTIRRTTEHCARAHDRCVRRGA